MVFLLKDSINLWQKLNFFLSILYIDYNKIFENKIKIEFNKILISWIIYLTNLLVYFIYWLACFFVLKTLFFKMLKLLLNFIMNLPKNKRKHLYWMINARLSYSHRS